MNKDENPYEILGISPDADEKTIKKAYRDAARIHHPDKQSTDEDRERATAKFAKIADAYNLLQDPVRRYDWRMANEGKINSSLPQSTSASASRTPPPPPATGRRNQSTTPPPRRGRPPVTTTSLQHRSSSATRSAKRQSTMKQQHNPTVPQKRASRRPSFSGNKMMSPPQPVQRKRQSSFGGGRPQQPMQMDSSSNRHKSPRFDGERKRQNQDGLSASRHSVNNSTPRPDPGRKKRRDTIHRSPKSAPRVTMAGLEAGSPTMRRMRKKNDSLRQSEHIPKTKSGKVRPTFFKTFSLRSVSTSSKDNLPKQ